MSLWLSSQRKLGKENSRYSLSLLPLTQRATRRQKYERRSFVSPRSFFKPKRARGRRDGRERENVPAARWCVPLACFRREEYSSFFFGVFAYLRIFIFISKNTLLLKTRDDGFVLFFAAATATARNDDDDSAAVVFRRSSMRRRRRGGNRAVPARQSLLRELPVREKRGVLPLERGRGYREGLF